MATEAVKDRVRKLLELSKSPEEHEAASALRRAEELMAKHGLTRADVEAEEAWTDDDVLVDPMLAPYRQMLVRSVALSRGVVALQQRMHHTVRVGFRGGAAATRDALKTYQAIRAAAKNVRNPFTMIIGDDGDNFFFANFWQTIAEVAPNRLGLPQNVKPRETTSSTPEVVGLGTDEKSTVDQLVKHAGEDVTRILFREARMAAERVFAEADVGPWRPDLRALAG